MCNITLITPSKMSNNLICMILAVSVWTQPCVLTFNLQNSRLLVKSHEACKKRYSFILIKVVQKQTLEQIESIFITNVERQSFSILLCVYPLCGLLEHLNRVLQSDQRETLLKKLKLSRFVFH